MTNATKKTTVKTTAAKFADAVTTLPPLAKAWDSNLIDAKVKIIDAVQDVASAIMSAEESNKIAAIRLATLHSKGFHTTAGFSNFADWFMLAVTAIVPQPPSKATVYRLAAAGALLRDMGEEAAKTCSVPMDALASMAGGLKGKPAEARGSIARVASKKFAEARENGATVVEALQDSGIRKAKESSADSLDIDGKIQRTATAAFTLAGGSYAEAFQVLHGAIDRLKALQAASIAAAKG